MFRFQEPFAEHYKKSAFHCLIKKIITLHLNKMFKSNNYQFLNEQKTGNLFSFCLNAGRLW